MSFDSQRTALIAYLQEAIAATPSLNQLDYLFRQLADARNTEAASGGGSTVTSYLLDSVQTNAIGTTYNPLTSGVASNVAIRNRTGVTIDIRQTSGSSVAIQLLTGEDIPLPCLANVDEWSVRRNDTSNTQVTINFLRWA